ncbi:MAG: tRNA pseudouridine(13) synthase TruD [Methanotrichaceae archaeon]|nr:tRNA pseudouridine(13) synthase TruD [Methanotrichaceae archaeon]MDD1758275.1 tRNA pseudouridine(13) synthase TruD [Methanotrichaceae archaeon]
MIPAPEHDRALGMDFYITNGRGCGGVLRESTDDFRVIEVYNDLRYEGGRYLVLEVEKKNWDTHHLIREMSRQLRISQKRFSWAGTKDKRAIARQRISIMNLDEVELRNINLPDLKMKVLGRTNRAVGLGDLLGNRFWIRIREIDFNGKDAGECISRITKEILLFEGVPNYFGVQRFGDTRPITHKVGESLVRGKIEEAVFIYLAQPFPGELEGTREARRALWDSRDIYEALKNYPEYLYYELALLNYLVKHPGDYAGSFKVLNSNLRRLFIHAYQSFLFNCILSHRIAAGLPMNQAIEGDVVCFSRQGLPNIGKLQTVTADNLEAVNRLARRSRAYVTLPLIGYESRLTSGVQGEIERKILGDEEVSLENFKLSATMELSSPGSRRAAFLRVLPQVRLEGRTAELEFFLPPGSYATTILREYMKI